MRRIIFTLLGLAVLVPASFLVYMRYSFMASEGYPTWEAVRNYLVRDGEIVIAFPEGVNVVSARCDDTDVDIQIDDQTVTTKIGYSWCTITIQTERGGRSESFSFNPQKLNSWNRMHFVPANPCDAQSVFLKLENGVEKAHSDVTRTTNSEQGAPQNP